MRQKLVYPESPVSPFYRKNLLSECLGKKIISIKRLYSDRYINEYQKLWYDGIDSRELFDVEGDCLRIEFSDDLVLNITTYMFWLLLSKSCVKPDGENIDYFDQYIDSRSYSEKTMDVLDSNSEIKSFLNLEVVDIFLLEETDFFRKGYLYAERSDVQIGGFGLTTSKGNLLISKGVFEDDDRWHSYETKLKKKSLKYLEKIDGYPYIYTL